MAFIPTLPTHLSTIHSHARIQSTPRYRIPLSIFPIRRAIIPAMTLSEGQTVPNFSQVATGGQTITQADISSGKVVVYFYPRDATPGCTTEAQDFRDMKQELANLQTKVYGISKDSIESHEQFVKDQSINFPLISDDGTLCEAFGVWKLRKRGDQEMMGIERSTFLLKDGKIVKEWRGMKASGHAAEVLEAIKAL